MYIKDLCIAPVSNLKIELFQFNEQFHKQFVKSLDMHKNVIERMDKQRILDITCVQKRGREKVDKSNFASIVKYDYEYTDKNTG